MNQLAFWTAFNVFVVLMLVLDLGVFHRKPHAIHFREALGFSFMWVALAQSWNLISGLTGYVSFGHVGFFGTGAYVAAILMVKTGWHWVPASLAGGVGATLYALHCTDDSPFFVAAWYSSAIAIVTLIGYATGRRWLRW
jgi:hypothetical protein